MAGASGNQPPLIPCGAGRVQVEQWLDREAVLGTPNAGVWVTLGRPTGWSSMFSVSGLTRHPLTTMCSAVENAHQVRGT